MPLAFATGRTPGPLASADLLAQARRLDVRAVFLSAPVPRPRRWRAQLKAGGVDVCGVAPGGAGDRDRARFDAELEEAAACAGALKAPAVVVEGGGIGGDRTVSREPAVERLVRTLHAHLRAGVPLAVRPGAGRDDLLGLEETGWLLGELPRLGLWFDPARVEQACRSGWGAALEEWVDAHAARCSGVFVHGLDAQGRGGAHPAEGGLDWDQVAGTLPRGVPWVLDLAPEAGDDALADAVAMLRSVLA